MTAAILAVLFWRPLLELPRPVPVSVVWSYGGRRVEITMQGEIQDPVRVFGPDAYDVWINGEKMTCRRYGAYRLVTFPILHNQEPCELY